MLVESDDLTLAVLVRKLDPNRRLALVDRGLFHLGARGHYRAVLPSHRSGACALAGASEGDIRRGLEALAALIRNLDRGRLAVHDELAGANAGLHVSEEAIVLGDAGLAQRPVANRETVLVECDIDEPLLCAGRRCPCSRMLPRLGQDVVHGVSLRAVTGAQDAKARAALSRRAASVVLVLARGFLLLAALAKVVKRGDVRHCPVRLLSARLRVGSLPGERRSGAWRREAWARAGLAWFAAAPPARSRRVRSVLANDL
mmetsp:Transcript_26780/g.85213  ORF Transcript_26780/g.85213 Transcript_26780/m.85213 type:complete len:258 (-) Transcript_26780:8-781(-)